MKKIVFAYGDAQCSVSKRRHEFETEKVVFQGDLSIVGFETPMAHCVHCQSLLACGPTQKKAGDQQSADSPSDIARAILRTRRETRPTSG